jgi:hypothetical protein
MAEVFNSHDEARVELLRRALAANPQSATLTYRLADALWDCGERDEFAAVFQRAYQLSPEIEPTLAEWTPEAKSRDGRKLRDKAQALIERGIVYSPVVVALAIGNAILGNRTEVERLLDYDRFFQCSRVAIPATSAGDDFFSSLAAEIKAGLRFYDSPDDRAIRKAWRNEAVLRTKTPACKALAAAIRAQVETYIARLPDWPDHPFVASRPRHYVIDGWAVVSGAGGYHEPHIHPHAWMSGVYYVVRPEISRAADTDRGWLRVGPPPKTGLTPECGWQQRIVEPEPGNIVLMPAYFYHDTRPLGVDQERICVAFDVRPIEAAGAVHKAGEH